LSRGGQIDLATIQAWLPWEQFGAACGDFAAQLAFAYDGSYLYALARVKDLTDSRVPSMLAGKELSLFQLPPGDYVYRKMGPWPASSGDFLLLSLDHVKRKQWIKKYELYPPGHPLRKLGPYLAARYQYAIHPTAEGGTDVFRLRSPDFYWAHPLPLNYPWIARHCKVEGAKAVARRTHDGYVYEVALPWTELRQVPHTAGTRIRLNVKIGDDGVKNSLVWSEGCSCAGRTAVDFDPTFVQDWSSETEWGLGGMAHE